jgi:phage terminase small subunit
MATKKATKKATVPCSERARRRVLWLASQLGLTPEAVVDELVLQYDRMLGACGPEQGK